MPFDPNPCNDNDTHSDGTGDFPPSRSEDIVFTEVVVP